MAIMGIQVTPDNRGPIINVIDWILLVLTSLATIAKIWSKWSLAGKLQADDYYLLGATLTAIGWIAAVSSQVTNGLGRHLSTMSTEETIKYQQTEYSSQILYVVSLCLAKMAILHFMLTLARVPNRRRVVYAAMVLNLVSLIVGIFAVAFQCPLPQPWATLSQQCFNQTSFWIAFGVMDILVDLATVIVPISLLHDLRTTWKRKTPAIVAFALRFLIIPMIIVRLVYVAQNATSRDHPFDDFPTVLTTAVHINFSVLFTCLPFLKTVIDNVQTGLLGGEIRPHGLTSPSGYRGGDSGNSRNNTGWGGRSMPAISSPLRTLSEDRSYQPLSFDQRRYVPRKDSGGSGDRMVINQTTTISMISDRVYTR